MAAGRTVSAAFHLTHRCNLRWATRRADKAIAAVENNCRRSAQIFKELVGDVRELEEFGYQVGEGGGESAPAAPAAPAAGVR